MDGDGLNQMNAYGAVNERKPSITFILMALLSQLESLKLLESSFLWPFGWNFHRKILV